MGHRFPETFPVGHFSPPVGRNETGYFFSVSLSRHFVKHHQKPTKKGQNFEFFQKYLLTRQKNPCILSLKKEMQERIMKPVTL
jgi:hypothetical protein